MVTLFLAGHVQLWSPTLGFAWPALPNSLATALTVAALVTAVALVIERLASRDSRALSRFQDYALPVVVADYDEALQSIRASFVTLQVQGRLRGAQRYLRMLPWSVAQTL